MTNVKVIELMLKAISALIVSAMGIVKFIICIDKMPKAA